VQRSAGKNNKNKIHEKAKEPATKIRVQGRARRKKGRENREGRREESDRARGRGGHKAG